MNRIEDYIEVSRSTEGSNHVRQIFCKVCREIVLDLPTHPTQSDFCAEASRFIVHMHLQHDIDIEISRCEDPKCVEKHGEKS